MIADLAADLDRIALHIPHVEAAAADRSVSPAVRAAARVELAVWRLAKAIAELDRERSGHSRTVPERDGGADLNGTEQQRTEANDV